MDRISLDVKTQHTDGARASQKPGGPAAYLPALLICASILSAAPWPATAAAAENRAEKSTGSLPTKSNAATAQARSGKSKQAGSCCSHMQLADAEQLSQPAKPGDKDAAAQATPPARREVLDPSQFPGMAAFGYASAKAAPEVMEKLFCYCGCDLTDKHTSLLDCFTSMHGLDCHICQEEAVLALKLHRDGMSVTDIQKTIDERYTKDYPFQEDTPAYKLYKSIRYGQNAGSDKVKFGTQVAGPETPDESTSSSGPPKLKPGKKIGKCCSGGAHEHEDKKKHKKGLKDREPASCN